MSWHQPRSAKPSRGILRSALKNSNPKPRVRQHRQVEEKEEDLLVFGYACKLFPPDEHSRMIARGQHLIPWNGDENLQLLIDRYDARASLHDLSEFDGDSWNKHYEISEEEERIEQLCDQERYLAMYADIAEENTRQEEEIKRLHASISEAPGNKSFKEVGFSYDNAPQAPATPPQQHRQSNSVIIAAAATAQSKVEEEHEERPFMAPSALAIPPDMEIPPTEKMHAIIEKTATFVSSQGAQMEIVLKAKQANNTQFMFLQFDHYLNPYYKHMVKRIKEGKYRPGMKDEEKEEEDSDSSSDSEGGYLHPSLFASSSAKKKEEQEENKEKYKAIQKVDPDHPLAKLIERGKRANALRQYNMMKSAVEHFKPASDNDIEPPPLPPLSMDSSAASSAPIDQNQKRHSSPQPDASLAIVPPPPDIQPMVDSVARQIAEEGDETEDTMRARNDPMLAFLLPSHELHAYYTFRKTFIREQLKTQQEQRKAREEAELLAKRAQEEADAEKEREDLKPEKSAPICFSIKTKKESNPKTNLLSLPNRLQMLGDDSGDDEEEETKEESEKKDQETEMDDTQEKEEEEKAVKRKFLEESKQLQEKRDDTMAEVLSLEPKKKATQKKPIPLPVAPLPPSNFTVVTPTGASASIAVFREKQAERRQKATLFLQMKNKDSPDDTREPDDTPKLSAAACEDIFQIEDDEVTEHIENSQKKKSEEALMNESSRPPMSEATDAKPSVNSPSIHEKASPVVTAVATLTLKDLITAASSRSSTPSSPSSKKDRKRRRSRSGSRSRQSTPSARRRRSRSRTRDKDLLPSSYRKMRAYSRDNDNDSKTSTSLNYQRSKLDEDENVPSAYKIENPEPNIYSNGSRHSERTRDRDLTPPQESSRHRSHKHHRQVVEKEKSKKRHRSHRSPSHKSKKKHHKHSKSKKKHKKSEKKKTKTKKKKRETASEEGEWSSSDNADSAEEDEKGQKQKGESANEKESSPHEDSSQVMKNGVDY